MPSPGSDSRITERLQEGNDRFPVQSKLADAMLPDLPHRVKSGIALNPSRIPKPLIFTQIHERKCPPKPISRHRLCPHLSDDQRFRCGDAIKAKSLLPAARPYYRGESDISYSSCGFCAINRTLPSHNYLFVGYTDAMKAGHHAGRHLGSADSGRSSIAGAVRPDARTFFVQNQSR